MHPLNTTQSKVFVLGDKRGPLQLVDGVRTDASVLRRRLIDPKIPESEKWRYDPGRNINLDTIAAAVRNAEQGRMVEMTDLSGKVLDLDPTLASLLQRRLWQIESCGWGMTQAQGEGLEKAKAKRVSDTVARELRLLPAPSLGGERPVAGAGPIPLVGSVAWAYWDGRSVHEKVWMPVRSASRGVDWAIGELPWVHPRRVSFGPMREPRLIDTWYQAGDFQAVGLDLSEQEGKFLTFLPRLFREYPEREGYAPRCMYWAFFKRCSARERNVLMEIFGRPWKIPEIDKDAQLSAEELSDAFAQVDALGAGTGIQTAQLPKGMRLNVPWPHPESGGIHKEIIDAVDAQLSRMLLGQALTTLEDSANRSQSETGERQQDIYLARDARELSTVIQTGIVADIVRFNAARLGLENDDAVEAYTPTFAIKADKSPNRTNDLARATTIAGLGVPLSVDQVYELSGFRKPSEDEEVLLDGKIYASYQEAMAAKAAAAAQAEAAQQAMQGLSGMGEPPTSEGPPPAPSDESQEPPAPSGAAPVPPPPVAPEEPGQVAATAVPAEEAPAPVQRDIDEDEASLWLSTASALLADPANDRRVRLADRFARQGVEVVDEWKRGLLESVEAHAGTGPIFAPSGGLRLSVDGAAMAMVVEEMLLRAALDAWSDHELGLAPTRLNSYGMADLLLDRMPNQEAIENIVQRLAVPKEQFAAMTGEARRRAFTIAGIEQARVLEAAQAVLTDAVGQGMDVRAFRAHLDAKFEELGATKLAKHHLENVFRTNVMTAYGETRRAVMSSPKIVEKRPYWMWVAVTTDGRARKTHAAANGLVVRADDPMWQRVRCPAGHQCRCLIRNLTAEQAEARGNIVTGDHPAFAALPDEGFGLSAVEEEGDLADLDEARRILLEGADGPPLYMAPEHDAGLDVAVGDEPAEAAVASDELAVDPTPIVEPAPVDVETASEIAEPTTEGVTPPPTPEDDTAPAEPAE